MRLYYTEHLFRLVLSLSSYRTIRYKKLTPHHNSTGLSYTFAGSRTFIAQFTTIALAVNRIAPSPLWPYTCLLGIRTLLVAFNCYTTFKKDSMLVPKCCSMVSVVLGKFEVLPRALMPPQSNAQVCQQDPIGLGVCLSFAKQSA
jgi:hypothetical protein